MTLRELKGGLLKSSMGPNNKPFLPQQQDAACQDTNKTIQCFGAGDSRVNNNLGLVGLHTLFMREHNRIAIQLKKLNDDWSDDRLFNEARRILIGIYQHIVFTEYLPALIGKNFVRAFDLDVTEQGKYYSGYNTNVRNKRIFLLKIVVFKLVFIFPRSIHLFLMSFRQRLSGSDTRLSEAKWEGTT